MPRKQTERKRRVHTRSRNGCVTCKAKHLRCDEQKPLCGRCLANGGSCGYTDKTTKQSQSPQPSDESVTPKWEISDFWSESLGYAPIPQDFASGHLCEVSQDHSILFDIFSRYRSVVDRDVSQDSHAFLVEKALSSPALLHCAVLLSALRWTWYSGISDDTNQSADYHKAKAVAFVNDRLQNPTLSTTRTTVTGIAALAMVESGFGLPDTARAHLRGLSQVLAEQAPPAESHTTLLQSMIDCTTRGLSQMTMRQTFDITHSIRGCSSTLCLFIEPELQKQSEDPLIWDQTIIQVISTESYLKRTDFSVPRSESESRARFLQCCLRAITLIGLGNLDFYLLNWFVEALIDEISMSENAMLEGNFPRNAWLWTALMARVAATSVQPSNPAESRQAEEWRSISDEKICQATKAMDLRTWDEAEALLQTWVELDDKIQIEQLSQIWEQCRVGRKDTMQHLRNEPNDAEALTVSVSDKHLFYLDDEKKPIIINDEAFDQFIPDVWM